MTESGNINLDPAGIRHLVALYAIGEEGRPLNRQEIAASIPESYSSACREIRELINRDLLFEDKERSLKFTPQGEVIAKRCFFGHAMLTAFLSRKLGMAPVVARMEAWNLFSILSSESIDSLRRFLQEQDTLEFCGSVECGKCVFGEIPRRGVSCFFRHSACSFKGD